METELAALRQASRRTVGTKETLKAVEEDRATVVYVAADADGEIVAPVAEATRERGLPLEADHTMEELGAACGIDVGAAAAAVIDD